MRHATSKNHTDDISDQHVLLVCKSNNESALECGMQIAEWLHSEGHAATLIMADKPSAAYRNPDIDFVVVLGGDGTVLGVTRQVMGRCLPVLGINFGRIGYLSAAQPEEWRERLKDFFTGRLPEFHCMSLRWNLLREGETIAEGSAVNDVVLSHGGLSRLLNFAVRIDGEDMGFLRSDGIIVSTPVGSSGYNISAGGPLLPPTAEMLTITPICAFHRSVTSMIFPGTTECIFSFSQGSTDCYMTVDGQEGQQLQMGDSIKLTGYMAAMCFVGRPGGFFEKLRSTCFTQQEGNAIQEHL